MEPPSCSVSIVNKSGRRLPTKAIRQAITTAFRLYPAHGDVSVLFADDRTIRRLNLLWRGIPEATDVLSFPAPPAAAGQLGDIAVAVPFAERQALARGVELDTELAYLAIHGALHLAGLNDETDEERSAMFLAMAQVAAQAGIPMDAAWTSLPEAKA